MRRAAAIFAAALALPAVARADGPDTRIAAVQTGIAEYRSDNRNGNDDDDNYGAFIERLNLSANSGGLAADLRLDAFMFADAPTADYRDSAQLERLTLRYRADDFNVEAGDFYVQLGRGIVLSVRKVDEAGRDISLRGGTVALDTADHGAMLFAGRTNPANLDPITQRQVNDSNDVIAGGQYELRAVRGLRAAVYGAWLRPEFARADALPPVFADRLGAAADRDQTGTAGLSVDLPVVAPWLALYTEGAVQSARYLGEDTLGYAGYATADLWIGNTAVLLEGLLIDDLRQTGSPNSGVGQNVYFSYNQPPTLERIDQEVLNNEDVRGGRLRVEQPIGSSLTAFANGLYRATDAGEPSAVQQIHAYAGVDARWDSTASRLSLSGGHRRELQVEDTDNIPFKLMNHAELDLVQSVGEGYSLHLSSRNEFRSLEGDNYARGTVLAGVERNGLGALTFEFGYDNASEDPAVANLFYAGIVHAEWNEHWYTNVTAGTQRGGIKCVNGVCREYPAFAGVRAELIARF